MGTQPDRGLDRQRAEVLDRAVAHGDEHVIKFTDTAAEVYARTGQSDALAAALRTGTLIPSPRD